MGTVLTGKYAEGYPGRRYYGGCEVVDVAENLARDRAKELFGAEHVNVQTHAAAQANLAVYHALLQRDDTVLGLSLDQGGHLTHGSPVNFSGQYNLLMLYLAAANIGGTPLASIGDRARLFALVNTAAADALICSWNAKTP